MRSIAGLEQAYDEPPLPPPEDCAGLQRALDASVEFENWRARLEREWPGVVERLQVRDAGLLLGVQAALATYAARAARDACSTSTSDTESIEVDSDDISFLWEQVIEDRARSYAPAA